MCYDAFTKTKGDTMTEQQSEIPQEFSWASIASDRYDEGVQKIADDLRQLADDIERRKGPDKTHVNGAREILHRVTWGVSGLCMERLFQVAEDADRAVLTELAKTFQELPS